MVATSAIVTESKKPSTPAQSVADQRAKSHALAAAESASCAIWIAPLSPSPCISNPSTNVIVALYDETDLAKFYLLTREGFCKSALAEYSDRKEATSRYMLAALILGSDAVKTVLRREIRRVSELLVEPEAIEKMLREEVLKRDAIEGPEAEGAAKRVARRADRSIRKVARDGEMEFSPPAVGPEGGS